MSEEVRTVANLSHGWRVYIWHECWWLGCEGQELKSRSVLTWRGAQRVQRRYRQWIERLEARSARTEEQR